MTKPKKVGGKREGAGAPLKNEKSGPRVPWSGRLDGDTVSTLKDYATDELSQAGIVDAAVAEWKARQRKK